MIGAYRATPAFAYPGWRLTVPGGPAGGHYKGFTHTQAAGTDIPPNDQYEQDREDGMSSYDPVHASPRNPRGVYRSSAEVPPRPNASGQAMTYRGYQTQRHPGTSVAPGSFPAPFEETDEDAFIARFGASLGDFGMARVPQDWSSGGGPVYPICPDIMQEIPPGCIAKIVRMANGCTIRVPVCPAPVQTGPIVITVPVPPQPGVVAQPPGTLTPPPPAPSVPVVTAPPVSPTPAPTVPTNEVVPLNDGSGNYINLSTGQIVPASAVMQNPATGQLTASSALSWLEEHSIWSRLPNWGVLAGGALLLTMFMGRRR